MLIYVRARAGEQEAPDDPTGRQDDNDGPSLWLMHEANRVVSTQKGAGPLHRRLWQEVASKLTRRCICLDTPTSDDIRDLSNTMRQLAPVTEQLKKAKRKGQLEEVTSRLQATPFAYPFRHTRTCLARLASPQPPAARMTAELQVGDDGGTWVTLRLHHPFSSCPPSRSGPEPAPSTRAAPCAANPPPPHSQTPATPLPSHSQSTDDPSYPRVRLRFTPRSTPFAKPTAPRRSVTPPPGAFAAADATAASFWNHAVRNAACLTEERKQQAGMRSSLEQFHAQAEASHQAAVSAEQGRQQAEAVATQACEAAAAQLATEKQKRERDAELHRVALERAKEVGRRGGGAVATESARGTGVHRQQVAELTSRISELESTRTGLLDQLAAVQGSKQAAEAAREKAEGQATAANKKARTIQSRLQQENATNLKRQIESLEAQLGEARRELGEERANRAALLADSERVEALEKEREEKAGGKRRAEAGARKLRERGREKTQRISELGEEVQRLQAELESRAKMWMKGLAERDAELAQLR